ncbi:MAG TPA: hypothetical protein VEX13_11915 [Chloroflexia bacterium]|nr:hypothetical protein [Chloroflexia bacterium]
MWVIVPERLRRPVCLLALGALLVAGYLMRGKLTTAEAPDGIISLELAGDAETAEKIINSWRALPEGMRHAEQNIVLDLFLFIPAYSTFIGLACLLAERNFRKGKFGAALGLPWIGTILAWGLTLAALLDIIETLSLWAILRGPIETRLLAIAKWCAIVKFALVFAGLAYTLVGLGYVVIGFVAKIVGRGKVPVSRM